ncbi:MAG: lipoprotein N-acyltransferase Lnb domain-containing protein [Flavitalea sp.]
MKFHASNIVHRTSYIVHLKYIVHRTSFSTSIFLFFSFLSYSQSDSCHLRFSLLTCSPGEELYSAWGHTAIRVTDRSTGMDMVFNYGTFDDSDPDFYLKFTKGIMHYALSAYPFSDFLQEYQFQGRGIVEQLLDLSCAEKTKIYNALQINNTEENRFYNYYFHTDNCTTRAKDMILKNTSGPVSIRNIVPGNSVTFRNLIHSYLDKGGQYWSKFGVDLFLGINLDKKVTNEEAMFLPDYLKKGFDSTQVNNRPLVSGSQIILPWPDYSTRSQSLFTPFVIFSVLLLIIGGIALSKFPWAEKVLATFDTIFFLVIGVFGILMAALWIFRIDTVCRNNLNLLWALPTHIAAPFFMHRNSKFKQKYFQVVFWISIALAFTWFFIPQQINNAVGPIILLIIIRSYHYSKKYV